MTDYEPYVSDPAEPRLPPMLARYRPLLVALIVLLLLTAVLFPIARERQREDPSFVVPVEPTP